MKEFPPLPPLSEAPDVLEGHLWVQELVAGGPLRFQVDDRGVVFGDAERVFDRWAEPLPYAHAVRHVREAFDAARFRDLVADPTAYVFYGVSTHSDGVAYDWARLPPFLGTDVWSDADGFFPPDRVERAFDRLGLDPVNAFEKEVPARDFDPDGYETPGSAWYDGPAAGVVVRNKRGDRAKREQPDVGDAMEPLDADAAELAATYATDDRVDAVAADIRAEGRAASVDAVRDRLVATVARELGARIPASLDANAFRSAVAERVSRRLG